MGSDSKVKTPAFQFYPDAWLSSESVELMTLEQQGAYIRLLCWDWLKDGLKDDDARFAALSGMREGWLKNGSNLVRECFAKHPRKDGYLTNPRLEKEREKQRIWREKSSKGGKKSAASRRRSKTLKGGSQMVDDRLQPNDNTLSLSLLLPSTSERSISKDILTGYQLRIGALKGRRASTKWSKAEMKSLREIGEIKEEDMQMIERYYAAEIKDRDIRRTTVSILLNNWPGELDRARNYKPPHKHGNQYEEDREF